MTRFNVTYAVAISAILVVGCSSKSDRDYLVQSSDDEYVYIVDYEKMAYIDEASRTSHSNVDTYWVNPPVKRIKRSELEAMRKKQ
ncbi:hypothetical protein [Kangiella taiwanensis]|uniref:Lipoprotein n=1 Tax=Kangiella taiwanensis TaxID=1079179 RepID=A0ABP8I2D4_9GAMM|nr:hypothetical protein [Kangiella taiwanensis]